MQEKWMWRLPWWGGQNLPLFITGDKCPQRSPELEIKKDPAKASAAAFMGPSGVALIPQRSLETGGRSQELAPRCQFHRSGPYNEPAARQLDKENKMENTEM